MPCACLHPHPCSLLALVVAARSILSNSAFDSPCLRNLPFVKQRGVHPPTLLHARGSLLAAKTDPNFSTTPL